MKKRMTKNKAPGSRPLNSPAVSTSLGKENAMTKKEYLKQIPVLNARINAKLSQAASVHALVDDVVHKLATPIQGITRNSEYVESMLNKLTDLEKEIYNDIDSLIMVTMKTQVAISNLANPVESHVLELRYLSNKSFQEIADETGKSMRQVFRIFDSAIDNLEIPN